MEKQRARYQIEALEPSEIANALAMNGYQFAYQLILDKEIGGKQLMEMTEFTMRQFRPMLTQKQIQNLWSFINQIQISPQYFEYKSIEQDPAMETYVNADEYKTLRNVNKKPISLAQQLKIQLKERNMQESGVEEDVPQPSNTVQYDDGFTDDDDTNDSFDDSDDDCVVMEQPMLPTKPNIMAKPALPKPPIITKPTAYNDKLPPKPSILPRPPQRPSKSNVKPVENEPISNDQNEVNANNFKNRRDALEQKFKLNPLVSSEKGPPVIRRNVQSPPEQADLPIDENIPGVIRHNKPKLREEKDGIANKRLPPIPIGESMPPLVRRIVPIPTEDQEIPEYSEPDETNLHMVEHEGINQMMESMEAAPTIVPKKGDHPTPLRGLRNGLFEPQPKINSLSELPDDIKVLSTEPNLPPRPIDDEYLQPVNKFKRPLPPTPLSDDVDSHNVSDQLLKHQYYRSWSREKCTNFLVNRPVGAFILRKSEKYYATLAVKGNSKIYNVPIICMNNSCSLRGDLEHRFSNINQLVQHFLSNELSLSDSDKIHLIDHLLPQ